MIYNFTGFNKKKDTAIGGLINKMTGGRRHEKAYDFLKSMVVM